MGGDFLQAAGLIEASGLAASRRHSGVLWALNDSGNLPILFAFDTSGADLGQVTLAGVKNNDWEDLAAFAWRGGTLFVGSRRRRQSRPMRLSDLARPA